MLNLLLFFLFLGFLSSFNVEIGVVSNLTKYLIIFIKDVTNQLTRGNQKPLFPDKLNVWLAVSRLQLFIHESLILFDLLIKLNNMREKFLNFLRPICRAEKIQTSAGDNFEFNPVFPLEILVLHYSVVYA